jgi:hypothetical protein
MASLDRTLRKGLETTVKKARRVAEAGARKAVAQLGVGEAEAPRHLSAEQRALRNRLRAHGRQLGDRRDTKTGVQDTAHVVQECAYEHWHRMLFARFLAETDLLIEPDSGVAITLEEVQELAREKATDWLELASDYAERMLPQIFRKDDPVLEIALPPETRSEMEDLLKALSKPVFEADDSLGWVYQFWQADKKDEVNKSEVKIGADELPAVTQLFTEDYMVLFLLHNTLGAWWAGKMLAANPTLAISAKNEGELRAACKVGDIDWIYLRFVRGKTEDGTEGPWHPAAGTFEGWPKATKDLTLLDPCMGSGHFLVFALPILATFRAEEEGLSQSAAVDAVLRDNLFGLEIDPRCTQIAAFNLAFAAWRKVGHRPLPQLNLACSGLAIGVTKAEWLKLAEKTVTAADPAAKRDLLGVEKNLLTVGLEERVKNGLETLYDLFSKAPWLGSLINPRRAGADILREGFDKLEPLLASTLVAADSDDTREMAVSAQGMAKAGQLLGGRFTLVCTNVRYLGRGKQHEILQKYCEQYHQNAKSDLSTCFVERCDDFCAKGGTSSLVTPQSWFGIGSYSKLRTKILKGKILNFACDLGPAAFNEMNWWAARTALIAVTQLNPGAETSYLALQADTGRDLSSKPRVLSDGPFTLISQLNQTTQSDARITLVDVSGASLLRDFADCFQGTTTGDNSRFILKFWELPSIGREWTSFQGAPEDPLYVTACEHILRWEEGKGVLAASTEARVQGHQAFGLPGLIVGQMGQLPITRYSGSFFSMNGAALIPRAAKDLAAIWCYCNSDDFRKNIRKIDQQLKVTNATIIKVPFDSNHWSQMAAERYPGGLPAPSSNDPTQWISDGNPVSSNSPLQVGVARLTNYRWPRQTGSSFLECPAIQLDDLETHTNTDGIVCLTALKGEPPAEHRLTALLANAYGVDWSAAKLVSLLNDRGFAGKSLDDWMRDGFFAQHCELFHQRPFIWHIWDGRRDGFHALVSYHHLAAPNGEGRRTLEKLIYSYLGDWIDRQRSDQKAGVEGADARLAHAEHLKAELIRILEGEPPYDIFVRWKPLHEQPIGWDPDINDGVRMNIRPFMSARPLNARGANACILRSTPKIKWDKDRGKEPARDKADYPWFWGWDEFISDFVGGAEFDGNRWNDLHYSRATKQPACDRHRASAGGKP